MKLVTFWPEKTRETSWMRGRLHRSIVASLEYIGYADDAFFFQSLVYFLILWMVQFHIPKSCSRMAFTNFHQY